jgi:hypothetical protein
MTDRRESGRVVRDTTFKGGNRDTYAAMKVPRQCPLVLLVKTDGKTFGNVNGRALISGAIREVEQGLTAFDRNFYINRGRAVFGEILMLTWGGGGGGANLGRNFDVNIGRASREAMWLKPNLA